MTQPSTSSFDLRLERSFRCTERVEALALDRAGERIAVATEDAVRVIDAASGRTLARDPIRGASAVGLGDRRLARNAEGLWLDGERLGEWSRGAIDSARDDVVVAASDREVAFLGGPAERIVRPPGTLRALAARAGRILLILDDDSGRAVAWREPGERAFQVLRCADGDALAEGWTESAIAPSGEELSWLERGPARGAELRLNRTIHPAAPRAIRSFESAWQDPVAMSGDGATLVLRRRELTGAERFAFVSITRAFPGVARRGELTLTLPSDEVPTAFALDHDGDVCALASSSAVHVVRVSAA